MAKPDFSQALLKADRILGVDGMPREVDRRLRQRLRNPPVGPSRSRTPLIMVALAASVLGLVSWRWIAGQPRVLGGLALIATGPWLEASVARNGTIEIRRDECTLGDPDSGESVRVLGP